MYEHFQRENFITPIFYLLEHNPENKYDPPDNDLKGFFECYWESILCWFLVQFNLPSSLDSCAANDGNVLFSNSDI